MGGSAVAKPCPGRRIYIDERLLSDQDFFQMLIQFRESFCSIRLDSETLIFLIRGGNRERPSDAVVLNNLLHYAANQHMVIRPHTADQGWVEETSPSLNKWSENGWRIYLLRFATRKQLDRFLAHPIIMLTTLTTIK